ncbi:MAG: hypothetical protein GQ471_01925 [Nitrosopumilus sp.]|nr:hypothetical protein [Nitrosopumilus sp.]
MEHIFFFDGNSKRITWTIQTNNSSIEQKREHADIYLNKVTIQQSKYIAMHVGLFWGIGRFIIKDKDVITTKIDSKSMFNQLSKIENASDEFIRTKIDFITQLIAQRKLKINYELVDKKENFASKLL